MSLNDQEVLQTDPTFIQRVRSSMIAFAVQVASEDPRTIPFHRERAELSSKILNNPEGFKLQFAASAATNTTVINEATQNNTVVLTSSNVAAQAALVVDTDINNAVASQWNGYLQLP